MWTKEQSRTYSREWNRNNKEKRNAITRRWYAKIKLQVITHYGGCCACCGETAQEFLTIDHINGGGSKHRRELGNKARGSRFYRWLVKNHFPDGFRILCWNCNCALGHFGYCPHTQEKNVES